MAHDLGQTCRCVADHRPRPQELEAHHVVPIGWGGPKDGEITWLCPASHTNVHELLRAWQRHGGPPPWSVSRYFSPFIRALAQRGYVAWQELTKT